MRKPTRATIRRWLSYLRAARARRLMVLTDTEYLTEMQQAVDFGLRMGEVRHDLRADRADVLAGRQELVNV